LPKDLHALPENLRASTVCERAASKNIAKVRVFSEIEVRFAQFFLAWTRSEAAAAISHIKILKCHSEKGKIPTFATRSVTAEVTNQLHSF